MEISNYEINSIADNKKLLFSREERQYISEALSDRQAETETKISAIALAHELWFDEGGIWHRANLDPFIYLPVLITLLLDNPEIRKTGEDVIRKYEPYLDKLDNPLEKSLFLSTLSELTIQIPNIVYFIVGKEGKLARNALYALLCDESRNDAYRDTHYTRGSFLAAVNQLGDRYWRAYAMLEQRLGQKAENRERERIEAEAQARKRELQEAQARAEAEAREAEAKSQKSQKLRQYTEADSRRNGWPPLEEDILFDPLRGHWDLWGQEEDAEGVRLIGRDPAGDILAHDAVGIDFGTSSTVAAVYHDGRTSLVRTGVGNWQAKVRARDFENPTSLEFVDMPAFMAAWREEHYRPGVSWEHLKCSHQARGDIVPQAPASQINSIIRDLKTWARNASQKREMVDQGGQLLRLCLELDQPAPAVNPVEIYAFHLGLALNNQYVKNGRIFRRYYLSFPATFDEGLRGGILAAFERGLERSLPKSLGDQEDWRRQTPFEVRAGVDEPVAYAAAALEGIEPEGRLAFGVFDFGGGTTDFAFGLYRESTPEEESKKGWEYVLELLDVSALDDLGGEALLHVLAHRVVCANLEEIAAKNAPFLAAPGEAEPVGSERVFGEGLIAHSNAMRLMEALRPLWEEGAEALDRENENMIRLDLQSATGEDAAMVGLKIDKEAMLGLLRERIDKGVAAFFTAFAQAFGRHEQKIGQAHILLAGNSCRNPMVRESFARQIEALDKKDSAGPVKIKLHDLLLPDDDRPEALTLKTGVAIGQLKTIPGMGLGVVRRLARPDQAFRFSFGLFRRNRLKPVLTRFAKHGEWLPMGLVREDLLLICGWSASPLALEGNMARGDAACHELPISFAQEEKGQEIFVRAAGPDCVEIALGKDKNKGVRQFTLGVD